MWAEAGFWLAWLAFGLVPGWVLLRLSGLRWSVQEQLAAAPGLSIAAVALAGYGCELLSCRVTPGSVGLALAAGAALVAVWQRLRAGRSDGCLGYEPSEPRVAWLVFLAPVVLYLLLHTLRDLVVLPPTVDDGVHHATWARLISERQTLSPARIYAPPVSDHQPVLYPWGFHVWVAVLARSSPLPWIESYWRAVLLVGSCVPTGVYLFATRLLPKGWPSVAAALCSVLFFWLPFQPYLWGGLALLAGATCAMPVARLTLDSLANRQRTALALSVLLGFGLLLIHPSQALGALYVCAIVSLAGGADARGSWRSSAWLIAAISAVGIAMVVTAHWLEPVRSFVERADLVVSQKQPRMGTVLWWIADLFTSHGRSAKVLGALCVLGAATSALRRELRSVLWLQLGLASLLPLSLARSWVTLLWYHDLERLWYLQIVAAPLLGAAGLWGIVTALARLSPGRLGIALRPRTTWPIAIAFVAGASRGYLAEVPLRLGHARATMVGGASYQADFAWIRERLPEHELVLNAPGDWGLVFPFTGRPVAFPNCQVRRSVPEHFEAFWALHDVGAYDEPAHDRIRALGFRYVYFGVFPPLQVATRAGLTFDGRALALNPGLERIYQSTTATIYRILDHIAPEFLRREISLADDADAVFDGFARLEQQGSHLVRWTTARATVDIPASVIPDCDPAFLVLGMWRPRGFAVDAQWDGEPLAALVEGIYPIPVGTHSLEIRSRTFVPSDADPSVRDGRALGVQLRGLSVECAESDTPGTPARTWAVPLSGSDDARFLDFHPVERGSDSSWRWTKERSLVAIRDRVLPTGSRCAVNLALGGPLRAEATVSWNGQRLPEVQEGRFRLGAARARHRIALASKTHIRAGISEPVGFGLWRVGFHCPSARELTASPER